MTVTEQSQLAEAIRTYFMGSGILPVDETNFGIDTFSDEGDSVVLHMEPGRVIKTYVDGTRIVLQPVSIFYRSAYTTTNGERSEMLGTLNKLGDWLLETEPLNLRPKFLVRSFKQGAMASLYIQDNQVLGYTANYVLEYETN